MVQGKEEKENSVGQGEGEALLRCRGIALPLRKEIGLKYDLEVECGKERVMGKDKEGRDGTWVAWEPAPRRSQNSYLSHVLPSYLHMHVCALVTNGEVSGREVTYLLLAGPIEFFFYLPRNPKSRHERSFFNHPLCTY